VVQHLQTLGRLAYRRRKGALSRMLSAVGFSMGEYIPTIREASGAAMAEYAMHPMSLPVVHFSAKDQPISTRVLPDPRLGWRDWVTAFETRAVAGDHFSMFDTARAPELARAVNVEMGVAARASVAS
jgi:surfactin synthase thioesterase subunit